MSERRGGTGRGGRGLAGFVLMLMSAWELGCVYDWPLSILTDGGEPTCGNGSLDPGEPCDGTDLGGETCGTQGFGGGSLACGAQCTLDTSGCQQESLCGDGWVGEGEDCDDGGEIDGDGCDARCDLEPGWVCEGEPSACSGGCGNGLCYAPEGENSATCPEDCDWIMLAAGRAHTCGVKGDGAVFCWGDNSQGQLGDGSGLDQASPVRVVGLPAAASVTAGEGHSCALDLAGAIWCWGDNADGQLGDGTIIARLSPVPLVLFPAALAVSAGAAHTCAVTVELAAFCWGRNDEGQLGDGDLLDRQAPTPVAIGAGLTTARSVVCGGSHSCAVREDDTLWCWGSNSFGQLGTGDTEASLLPRAVDTLGGFTAAREVSAGAEHTCAVDGQQELWCWGNGGQRRLGDGGSQNRSSPVPVITLGPARGVAAGGAHTCAVEVSGSLYCWGVGTDGQLGILGSPPQSNPVPVVGIADGLQVVGGDLHSCALLEAQGAWCWGAGLDGQLGQGVATGSATAVPVNDPY